MALSETCKEAIWLRRLLEELGNEFNQATIIYADNQSCLQMIKEEKVFRRTKHIDTRIYSVKDFVEKHLIECVYCPTSEMLADLLTKPLSCIKIRQLREWSGLYENEE